jgi:hypothetical protein
MPNADLRIRTNLLFNPHSAIPNPLSNAAYTLFNFLGYNPRSFLFGINRERETGE